MAEGRFLSRNIAFSEQLGQVSMEADYLFMRMLPHLDREGRLSGSATSIRARVCPLRSDLSDASVAAALAELDQAKLIVWYEVDGLQCVEYPQFEKHQVGLRKDRETPSKVPASSALGAARIRTSQATPQPVPSPSGNTPAESGNTPSSSGHSKGSEVKGRESKSREGKTSASDDAAPKNWVALLSADYTDATEGHIPPGELGRALKPLITTHGLEETRSRWTVFIHHADVKYGVQYFAKHFGNYKSEPQYISGDDIPAVLAAIGVTP